MTVAETIKERRDSWQKEINRARKQQLINHVIAAAMICLIVAFFVWKPETLKDLLELLSF